MSSQTRCSAPKTGPSDAPFAMLSAQRWCDEVVNSAPHSRPQPPRTGVPISGPRGRMEPFPDMRRNRRCGVGQDGRPSRQCEASDNGGNAGIGAPRDRMSRHPAPAAGWSPSRTCAARGVPERAKDGPSRPQLFAAKGVAESPGRPEARSSLKASQWRKPRRWRPRDRSPDIRPPRPDGADCGHAPQSALRSRPGRPISA